MYVLNGNGNGSSSTATIAPPEPAAPATDEVDVAYLERRLVRLLGSGPRSAEQAAQEIDAPVDAVRDACDRLTEAGDLSRLADGTYVS